MGGLKPSKPKPQGPSKEQLALQREQAELAKKQQQQIEEQKVRLAEQEANAAAEAERERQQRIKGQKASRLRRRGRSSLIGTGSELGTSGSLG